VPDDLIRPAVGPADIAQARTLFRAYEAGLGVSLCFQDFDRELAALPDKYVPPRGGLWLAVVDGVPRGCVALRALPDTDDEQDVVELKRLFVADEARGRGLGRRLALTAIDHGRAAGARTVKLDTLAHMDAARALYADLGFVACPAYYANPLGGTLYMALAL
jgi:GNAT superfamily N-acetyltransferase